MFNKIMVPVDLNHAADLKRALQAAGDLAKTQNAEVTYVGVFDNVPTSAAHTKEENASRLTAFAAEQSARHGIRTAALPVFSADPGADLGAELLAAIETIGADVVVMASHVPGWLEHVFSSNAGYLASHAPVSVFVVRPAW